MNARVTILALASMLPIGVLLAVTPVGTARLQDSAAEKELKKFQGTWKVVASQTNGVKIPLEAYKKTVVLCKGDRLLFRDGDKTYEEIEIALDPAASPKTVDYTYVAGLKKGVEEKGIYELEGDKLTLCIAPTRRKRPTELASPRDSGIQLLTLRRQSR